MSGIGHNGGPALDAGVSYRRFLWKKARHGLMGETLSVEVIRMRVRRAAELGLPYRSYASIRASTGRDVIGFLFSTNALRIVRAGDRMPAACADRLAALGAARVAAVHHPLAPGEIAALAGIDRAGRAPRPFASWPDQRAALAGLLGRELPRDGIVLVADAPFEREWCEVGKLAGALTAEGFFGL
ncbi:hypothetical protein [Celeribacter indicus]|uniref:Uncharacterized protein n=1 Tax=Celeribacter indicus TaxID=1208324 RepID=A0A0B5E4Q8_9RHOB|nr:hypothetical protein [Celeribacter indicus]AJE48016.1 hypothetical protein P73_3301 [Celeribacter indicus]SDW29570.1 hypothetical protein SAMN05443573_102294 [Celeribacter indicus]